MKLAGALLLICLGVHTAFADDSNLTLTVDGVSYEDVRWGNATPSAVTIFHRTGIARIPLEKLSPELQQKFGYDPEKAADYRRRESAAVSQAAQRDAAARAEAARRETERAQAAQRDAGQRQWADMLAKKEHPRYREINGKLYDFSPAIAFANQKPPVVFVGGDYMRSIGGNLPPGVAQSQQAAAAYQREMAKWGRYLIRGKVIQVLQDGLLVDCDSRIVFVKNYPLQSSVVDGDSVDFVAMPVGSYSYANTAGARTTVRAFDFGTVPSTTSGALLVQAGSEAENGQ
jgi:hypothetical protein